MRLKPVLFFIIVNFFFASAILAQTGTSTKLHIDLSKTGARVPSSMYGVFFEEINHSGDGGLYAELIQNRGFEDNTVPGGTKLENGFAVAPSSPNYRNNQVRNFKVPWNLKTQWPGWSLKQQDSTQAVMNLSAEYPLNSATPQSMRIEIAKATTTQPVELANEGFWGVAVKQGEKYNLRFFLRNNENYKGGNVTAKIVSADGKVLAQNSFTLKKAGVWNEYMAQFVASATDPKAAFILSFNEAGTVYVDFVSLFPEKTFKNRKYGLRQDVAQLLSDLHPAFMRWPGGCIVEGLTLENRVKWKETLGDPLVRPGQYDVWGYRNSYGFGYHEFLQYIEDIGAKGMFVANIGVSCSVRNGDYCKPEEVSGFIQDALDAIEYAMGDVATTWGAKRAAAGHPKPFPLQYVEIGNEDAGPDIYNERFNLFQKAITAKYPQITIISNHGLNDNMSSIGKTDMIDPHYYVAPEFFYSRANTLFDNILPRPVYKSYVGEFAVNRNVGPGNMNGTLSEAAFLIGAERNADFVSMLSYAPLIENSNKRDWPVNMIWVKSDQSMGRTVYYLQKLFTDNRPDINYHTLLQEPASRIPQDPFKGMIGFATNRAKVEFKDMAFSSGGNTDNMDFKEWQAVDGKWSVNGNAYAQADTAAGRHFSFLKNKSFGDGTVEFKFQKATGPANQGGNFGGGGGGGGFGNNGSNFAYIFGAADDKNYYQLSFTGRTMNIGKVVNGMQQQLAADPLRMNFDDEHSYNVKVATMNDNIEVFIDGKSVFKYKNVPDIRHYAIAGLDEKANEIIVKVVNAESTPLKTDINLTGAGNITASGKVITMASSALTEENSFEQPTRITPQEQSYNGFSNSFTYEFKPYSVTILRLKKG